jgi:hypothetical protein
MGGESRREAEIENQAFGAINNANRTPQPNKTHLQS